VGGGPVIRLGDQNKVDNFDALGGLYALRQKKEKGKTKKNKMKKKN